MSSLRRTGLALVASAVLAAVGGAVLTVVFDWPGVLDRPGTEALPRFAADASAVRGGFYLMLLASLLLIPAAIGLAHRGRTLAAFGVIGAVLQILGWVRWPIAVPGLAERFTDPNSSEAARTANAAAYDLINAYAGGAVGEHLGFLFQGIWAIGLGVVLVGSVRPWFARLGLALAVGWVPLTLGGELFGIESLEIVGSTVYTGWYLWLGALGVVLVAARSHAAQLTPVAVG